MKILKSKLFLSIAGFLFLLVVLSFTGRRSVHAELVIDASPEKIWKVISDGPGFRQWNPVFYPVEGELREGSEMKIQITDPNGKKMEVTTTVREVIEPEKFIQCGGIPGVMTFEAKMLLKPQDGQTLVVQHEEYRGIISNFWYPKWLEEGYQRSLKALSERVRKVN